ncbi:MAG: hypothetical protein ACK5L5_12355 [Bacteroidales bacterium]
MAIKQRIEELMSALGEFGDSITGDEWIEAKQDEELAEIEEYITSSVEELGILDRRL